MYAYIYIDSLHTSNPSNKCIPVHRFEDWGGGELNEQYLMELLFLFKSMYLNKFSTDL